MGKKRKNMIKIIKRLDRFFLGLMYPRRCPICDGLVRSKEEICVSCRSKINEVKEPVCITCGKPLTNAQKEYCTDCKKGRHVFVQGKALWVYEKEAKDSLYRYKYSNKREYGETYGKLLAKKYGDWIKRKRIEAILPVPLHKSRKRQRGYNQAEIIAKELGESLGIPVYTDVLVRTKNTRPQKKLNDSERKNNLKKAFKTTKSVVQLNCVLLVDDIYTTGSTVDAATLALLEAGVKETYVCCIGIGEGY